MTDLDRRILTKACGLEWRERMLEHGVINIDRNRTFTTPDDWELVRVKVVVPNVEDFARYLYSLLTPDDKYYNSWSSIIDQLLTIQLCQLTTDFIKSRPDLFPWVEEMEEGNG